MTATMERSQWATEPFVLASDEEFARLRQWLIASRYTEADIVAAAGVESTYAFPQPGVERQSFRDPSDKQTLLVQLFLDGARLPWEVVRGTLGAEEYALLDRFGLLQPAVNDAGLCVAPIALYPVEGVYIASDRLGGLETIGEAPPADLVYSALTPQTHRFIELMPRWRCSDYLELCSGTGVAALIAAKTFADRAWAIDITERSTRFADFNRRLNGLANFVALEGNLYEPVRGRTFDLITAHPPYVASATTEMVFRDAGEDGEQVSRAAIAGLPEYLRPGGQFYCDCMMTDRTGRKLEHRVRDMLGAAESEFDVFIGQASVGDPIEQYVPALVQGRSTPELFLQRAEAFKRLEISAFVSTIMLVQRRATSRPVITKRRIVTGATTAEDFQWMMRYSVRAAEEGDSEQALFDARPRLLPRTEWRTRLMPSGGTWRPTFSQLVTYSPFAIEADCPPWMPTLLAWCDGATTVRELLARLRADGLVGEDGTDQEFATLIRRLADAPFIEIESCPLPDATAMRVTGVASVV